ncbi:MAG TPA: SDR family NAD(P)-dependent oxidoreductase [Solirubrobacterales bacterium]|nr:SDR family NAD(P)-dependent oxidoreductase [Solirubrobacterales bacterium]
MTDRATLSRYLRKVTGELRDANRRIEELERRGGEPIAIVGMGCRYPGGASSPQRLWDLVGAGADAVSGFPEDRGWDLDGPGGDGGPTREGGFVADAAEFDAEFFGLSPRDALAMDPQQRLLLEAAWETFEDAGIDPTSVGGADTGVFAGSMNHDYGRGAGSDSGGNRISGGSGSVVSGRIAYSFGLVGPAVTVDTACSSSLVALHLAVQALRAGECGMALAGGVAVHSTPWLFTEFGRQQALAADGRCRAFAAAADGTGFAEGVGLVLVERLADAERNGHRVLATIRGSATNQDGASNGLTAPNGPAQERVIRQALANAGLGPADVDAVEAHGTGTTLGDPIEAQALLATYGRGREGQEPLLLGSIKSNIGHAQAAAGIAGVIKMVLALGHEELPPTLHVDAPTPHVDWSAGAVELLTEPRPWARGRRPRRAGVSSFGISGTNAHVILEEAPVGPDAEDDPPTAGPLPATPLLLSARSEPALREQGARLASHLRANPDLDEADVGYSLVTSRAALPHRAAAVGADRAELLEALDALAAGEPHAALAQGRAAAGKLAFLFSGQGAQRAGMGSELYGAFPAFAAALDEVCAELDPLLKRPLRELLFAPEGSAEAALLDRTEFTQPALFAVEVALFRLLESWGVRPYFLIGHSIGELSAAHVAGVLDLADACKLIAARGALMGALPEGGVMVAIEAEESEVGAALGEQLSIAAINSPTSLVVSGPEDAALQLAETWKAKGRKATRLRVSHAFHSALMEPMLAEFATVAQSLSCSEPRIPIVSNLSGEPLSAEQATDPAYWVAQVREPVRFMAGIRYLAGHGAGSFLELGPDAVLSAMARGCLADGENEAEEASVAPLLRRERPEARTLLAALAGAHLNGVEVGWDALFTERGAARVPLPTYAFQRKRYWLEAAGEQAGSAAALGLARADHPLLGAAISLPGEEGDWLLTGRLSLKTHPWLTDHAVLGTVILPGTAFVELGLQAAERAGAAVIEELTIEAPLALAEGAGVQVAVSVGAPEESGSRSLEIHSRREDPEQPEAEWVRNASGALAAAAPPVPADLGEWPPAGADPLPVGDFYVEVAALGADYGPAFQGLRAAWRRGEELFAEVELAPEQAEEAERFGIHPALLDAALHPAMLGEGEAGEGPRVPFAWAGVYLLGTGAASLRIRLAPAEAGAQSLLVADAAGAPLLAAAAIAARPIAAEQLAAAGGAGAGSLFALRWSELELPAEPEEADAVRRFECAPATDLDPPAAALALCTEVLAVLQEAIADPEPACVAFLTHGAMAVGEGESADPVAASVWGLVRSAQAEHPGRFVLLDSDGGEASQAALAAALAIEDEPQIALRDGVASAPRLAPAPTPESEQEPSPLDPEGTVLVTGGTGTLGALFARHLVAEHGVRHLVLTSRRGPDAPGAAELATELSDLGAEVEIAACDASDRAQVEALIAAIPAERPLVAIVHAAGVTDDGLVDSLDRERLATTLAPKADAAWHLHELTQRSDCELILFSSIAGSIGNPGQGNYAAANAFLDALAHQRRAQGLPALALGWGGWERESEISGRLSAVDRARLARGGIVPFADAEGLALFDRARALSEPQLLPVRLDRGALRAAAAGSLAPLLSGLVHVPARRPQAATASLAGMAAAERAEAATALVRTHVAAVLGHAGAAEIDPEAPFKDLGFDSLAAVELRNRLGQASGLKLPSTLVFDYPTPAAVAGFLLAEIAGGRTAAAPARSPVRAEEPIAIVGMSCRFPGGVNSPAQLWELLAGGVDAISGFPDDRGWDLERLYDPDPDRAGSSYARHGGFLADAAEFDAEFFGISPREARVMDPQQRLLLEAAWEAVEDAGLDPAALAGTDTGVFAGVMHHDYGLAGSGSDELGGHQGAVSSGSIVSGRAAYSFGLEGPAVTVDTACSSSLVALHLAAQSLRAGECGLALAGGVTVISTPGLFVEFSRQRGLAADGRCRSFAAAADGTGFSEGVGLVLLERLSEAERNGHEPIALLRGSATNQDGASNGLTAPNGPSQERVIRQALANAGLAAAEVDAVEGHGTATPLGDPVEAQALLATYGQDRERPLWLGSIKSNIGHAQAAAGIAGVIKMALAMRHGELPRTLHVDEPTPHVDWSAGAVELLAEPRAWESEGRPRRAAVSSFGISGTNAHVILEQPASAEAVAPAPSSPLLAMPLLLSARGEAALREQGARLAAHLRANSDLDPLDAGLTLATSRAALSHRAAAVGADRAELLEALDALTVGEPHPALSQGRARDGKLAFLFSGQGAQRPGMGKELYESFPAFAAALDEVCAEVDPHLGRSLKQLLFAPEDSAEAELLDRTEFTQPALFAIEVALFRLLESWGVRPDFLIGHSIGELAAAHVAGVFDLADACKLIAARGALMGALPEGGAMVAIEAEEAEVLESLPEALAIAAINAPAAVVVSGPEREALELAGCWKERGRKATRLRVSHAFHSALMEPMLADFAAVAEDLTYREPSIPIVSNLSGEPLTPEQATDPGYWVAQVREPVRFAAGVGWLESHGAGAFLELGPDAVLSAMARGCLAEGEPEAEEPSVAPLLRHERPEARTLIAALAGAHVNGVEVEWEKLFADRGAERVPLPTYAFQRKRYWIDSTSAPAGADPVAIGQSAADHPLLGAAISLPGEEGDWLLTGRLSLKTHPWLADHAVLGTVILPGTAFVELGLQAAERAGAAAIEELTIEAPLVLAEQGAVQFQVSVGVADEAGRLPLQIHSRREDPEQPEAEWTRNASGALTAEPPAAPADLGEWPPAGVEPLPVEDFYAQVAALGADYGPAFQGLRSAWRRGEELFAEVELAPEQAEEAERFGIHPALLDAALHPAMLGEEGAGEGLRVPFSWSGVALSAAGATSLRVRLAPAAADPGALSLLVTGADGRPCFAADSVAARPISVEQLAAAGGAGADSLFALRWSELELPAEPEEADAVRRFESIPAADLDPPAAALALCAEVLAVLQEAIADPEPARIAFLTHGAVAVAEGESSDPVAASVWGLVRSAQAEHPGRFVLLDSDGGEASRAALGAALANEDEPQLALRDGVALAPRLAPAPTPESEQEPSPLDPEGTVLVTGGTGTLGTLLARHLVAAHGVRHLILTSRRGPEAPGAADLLAELSAEAEVVACDVSDRAQVEALIASIPAERPLAAIVHAAGVTDDGLVDSLDRERLATTLAPKANAAWHLHELTQQSDCELILFSSIAGSIGNPGQGNYAAANAFLDALAHNRSAVGLPALALGWGGWERESEMSGRLDAAARARIARAGIVPFADAEGLALFDRARTLSEPQLLPVRLDRAALRAAAAAGTLAPLLSGLVRVPARRPQAVAGSLSTRLAGLGEAEREQVAGELVRTHVAAVLGHAGAAEVDPEAPFKDLGFDSLAAVELRNRLGQASGLKLPSTLVFDYPTPAEAARFLCSLVAPSEGAEARLDTAIDGLRALLEGLATDERRQADARLRALLEGTGRDPGAPADAAVERIEAAGAEELLAIVDEEIGAR